MTDPYWLIDAEAEHRAHPDTFEAVDQDKIDALVPGGYIKVGARFDPSRTIAADSALRAAFEAYRGLPPNRAAGERFWLQIAEIVGERYIGQIMNDLLYTRHHGLARRDPLVVERRHILDTMPPDAIDG